MEAKLSHDEFTNILENSLPSILNKLPRLAYDKCVLDQTRPYLTRLEEECIYSFTQTYLYTMDNTLIYYSKKLLR
jgi:hypothetical protein